MAQRKQPYPVTELTGGLNVALDPLLLTDRESPEITEVRFHKGLLKKEYGMGVFGSPLLGIPMFIDAFYVTSGSAWTLCITTTSAYKLNDTTREWEDITQGEVVEDCEDVWDDQANVTSSVSATDYKIGEKSLLLTVGAAFTTGLAASEDVVEADLSGYTHIHLWVKSSIDLDEGDISLLLDDTEDCASPIEDIDFPALSAGVWTRVSLALAEAESDDAIISVGIKINTDNGAFTLALDDIRAVLEFTGDEYNPFFSTSLNDTYILVNGIDLPKKWTGTGTFADLAGLDGIPLTAAKTVCVFQNRVIFGGTTEGGSALPQRVRWSSVGTIETWEGGTSGWVDIVDTVDWIMHIKLLRGRCFVYKDYSIWELLYVGGTSVFLPELKINGSGTMAPNTIIDRGETHILFSAGNVVEFDGQRAAQLGDNIVPLLYETGSKIISLADIITATALFLPETETYMLSFPHESLMFRYNARTQSWVRFNDITMHTLGYYYSRSTNPSWETAVGTWETIIGSWTSRVLPANAPTVLLGDDEGQIFEDDRTTASTKELVWVTRDFMFGHAHRITEVRVDYRYGGLTLYYSIDGGENYISLGTLSFADNWAEGVKYVNETTQRIRFKITTSEVALEIRWIEPWYVTRIRSKVLVED